MKDELITLREQVRSEMDLSRYEHTLGVESTAAALAMCYGADVKKAQIAGLLHDCAKCIPNPEKIKMCEDAHLPITEWERANPGLLHAKLGSYLAEHKYGITDPDILNSITYHTTGRPGMSLLEIIIFLADYIEPGRSSAKNLKELRKGAFLNLEQTLLWVLEGTLNYLESIGINADPQTRYTYEYYKERITLDEEFREECARD
jgi:predicted HD superfamily hydrolase involved in NAD metabolism